MSAEAVIARAIARRGEIFDEFRLLAQESPRTYDLISNTAGCMHHYTGAESAQQNLSGLSVPMRELIALCQLCAKGDDRFAANHVRRLWQHGITNKVMVEAATAIAPIVGWSTIAHITLALVKSPKRLDYASAGVGGSHHVVMEMFKSATGIALNHVPYRGATQAAVDVQAGHVPVMFSALAVVLGPLQSQRLRALGVANAQRTPLLPQTPTIAEAGGSGFVLSTWTGLFAPRGTAPAIIEKLNAEVVRAVNDSNVRSKLQALGGNPQATTPQELSGLVRTTTVKMRKVIADAKITAE